MRQKSNMPSRNTTTKAIPMAQSNWRYLLFLILAHHPENKLDHTIHLLGNVYVCTRCTGVAFGIAGVFAAAFFGFMVASPAVYVLIGVLPVFAAVDWFTQSAKRRSSNTGLRLATGLLLGVSEGLAFLMLFVGNWLGFLVAVALASVYAVCVYVVAAKTGCFKAYLAELNSYTPQNVEP